MIAAASETVDSFCAVVFIATFRIPETFSSYSFARTVLFGPSVIGDTGISASFSNMGSLRTCGRCLLLGEDEFTGICSCPYVVLGNGHEMIRTAIDVIRIRESHSSVIRRTRVIHEFHCLAWRNATHAIQIAEIGTQKFVGLMPDSIALG